MEFKPFWDQLADLGIALPEPYKIRLTESGKRVKAISYPQEITPTRWYKAGEAITISGYEISGMVYVGESMAAVEPHRGHEPALMNPTAFVNRHKRDDKGKNLSYYGLSYQRFNGEQRAAYLNWLATGRSNPEISRSYVTLFVYGLERRVFYELIKEGKSEERDRELEEIAQELERLVAIYKPTEKHDYQAAAFCKSLTQAVQVIRLIIDPYTTLPIELFQAREGDLKLLVGQTVAQGNPISAPLALAYAWTALGVGVPAVAQQFPKVFQQIFEQNYQKRFGQGLVIKPGKVKFRVAYAPLSSSFANRNQTIALEKIPDISRQTTQLQPITELIKESRYTLEGYSRYISQNPREVDSPKALGYLPVTALKSWKSPGIDRVNNWLKEQFPTPKVRHQLIQAKDIMAIWSDSANPHITKSELKSMGNLLEALDYGLEPDGRHVAIDVPAATTIVLYRLGADRPPEPSQNYQNASLMIHMVLAIASGEENASAIEQQAILAHIPSFPGLGPTEQAKLIAHMYYLQPTALTLARLNNRIEAFTGNKRDLAGFLISIAASDGQLSPAEVKRLEKAYKILGLEEKSLYSDIHNANSGGGAIAQPSGKKKPKLDMATVQAKIAESQEVSTLLADIFIEEEPAQKPTAKAKKKTAKTYASLDAKHSALLEHLAQADQWERNALLPVAENLGLMLDGALEVINEAAFDLCDEPVLEGHDSIEIDRTVMEQLLA